jgi:hypothetical protein
LVVPLLLLAPSLAAQAVTPPFESSVRASAALVPAGRRARATTLKIVVALRRRGQPGEGVALMIVGGAAV